MDLTDILKKIHFLGLFDSEIIKLVQNSGTLSSYTEGEKIKIPEDEIKSSLFIVLKGRLHLSLPGSDGTSVPLMVLSEGDFWGEYGLLDGENLGVEIISLELTKLFICTRKKLLDMIAGFPDIGTTIIQNLVFKLRSCLFTLDSLMLKDSDAKVARTLLKLSLETGTVKNGMLEIEKLPAQSDVAKSAGTSRETISKTLQSFTKKGFIELDGTKLRIKDFMKFRELIK